MPALQAHIYDVFQTYSRLYQLRNDSGGTLTPELQKEWIEVTFTLDSIFSGLYRPDPQRDESRGASSGPASSLRKKLPVDYLRVPADTDVLCETRDNFFSGKLQDVSVGGAYLQSSVPFQVDCPVRLTFCTFRDREPLELEGRIAWSNPGSIRKQSFPEGAGVQFTRPDRAKRQQLQDYVYELVEKTLSRAYLI